MKLYYSPGACSLADHIALHEAGMPFEHARVDLKTHTLEDGSDYRAVNPKGYVPALKLDSGETLSENIAILDWITQQAPQLAPGGQLGRTHLLEALAYISTEVHKAFAPIFKGAGEEEQVKAREAVAARLRYLGETMAGDYLLGPNLSVADCYLFVMLLWAGKQGIDVPPQLAALTDRMMARESVHKAMAHEGLL